MGMVAGFEIMSGVGGGVERRLALVLGAGLRCSSRANEHRAKFVVDVNSTTNSNPVVARYTQRALLR